MLGCLVFKNVEMDVSVVICPWMLHWSLSFLSLTYLYGDKSTDCSLLT